MQGVKAEIHKNFGWHFLAKEVSDFTRLTFYEVLERSAVEILSTVLIIQNRMEYNKAS